MDNNAYYSKHSEYSKITSQKPYVDMLPKCPEKLFKITQNLVIHELKCQWGNYDFAKPRFNEANIRYADMMLELVYKLKASDIFEKRQLHEKLITSCRGASLLYAALLREVGIPARLRSGFITYHPIANFNVDHVIVEYFNQSSNEWRWADVVIDEAFTKTSQKYKNLNGINLSDNDFITAEKAWQLVRNNQFDSFDFGVGLFKNRRGLFTIRNRLLHELALRLKFEMLPADLWGYMLFEGPSIDPKEENQLGVLDHLANSLQQDNLNQLESIYQENPALKIPSIVLTSSLMGGVSVYELGDKKWR